MQVGSVVKIFAATAGKHKYHLCLRVASDNDLARFLFINSDPSFRDLYVIDDSRLPYLPASPTGKSCFSFSLVIRMTERQLEIFEAEELGVIDYDLAQELLAFAANVRSLTKSEHGLVIEALSGLVQALEP